MKESIGNYEVSSSESTFKLSYTRTLKDWVDILIALSLGLVSMGAIIYLIGYILDHEFEWIYILIVLCLSIFGFIKLSYSISRLTEPTKGIIDLEKQRKTVLIRLAHFKKLTMNLSELSSIEYHLVSDVSHSADSDNRKRRFGVEVELVTKSKNRIKFLHINPSTLIDYGSSKIKHDLLRTSKLLVKRISTELQIEKRWKGEVNEE